MFPQILVQKRQVAGTSIHSLTTVLSDGVFSAAMQSKRLQGPAAQLGFELRTPQPLEAPTRQLRWVSGNMSRAAAVAGDDVSRCQKRLRLAG